MAASASETGGSNRYFSGENEDSQEYKRWKTWVQNKIRTLDKLPKEAAGSFVFTLLTGKALECVEHLPPEDYQREGGDQVLFSLLDTRFPQKDTTDELGEMMNEIFQLKSQSGETLKGWIGRSSELFDRLKRKTGVNFPEEARGWLVLNRCGLSEQEKAVVLARCNGNLKREEVGKALRSCFPEMVLSTRKTVPAHVVEDFSQDVDRDVEPEVDFSDIELFLAEHGQLTDESLDREEFPESEIAEVLAISWKERRAEINRLQKARKFQQVKEMKRQFRVEIEEVKRKSRCNRCQKMGHWARECPMKGKGGAKGSNRTSSVPAPAGAALVEAQPTGSDEPLHFVAMISSPKTLLERMRDFVMQKQEPVKLEPLSHETLLVSSPGFGVLDSGCGKSIIGMKTFEQFSLMWRKLGVEVPTSFPEINHFRYGNGHHEVSTQKCSIACVHCW